MRVDDQRRFREELEQEAQLFSGGTNRDTPLFTSIARVPDLFDSLCALSRTPELDPMGRRVVHRVIKYLLSPLDLYPEFVYGPRGYLEDLALVALATRKLGDEIGPEVLSRCGLSTGDPALVYALGATREEIGEDVIRRLELLLEADAVAGDEELEREDAGAAHLWVDADHPKTAGNHTIIFAGPGTGKTFRIETELLRLLLKERVPSDEILVTTFTNKAADELRVRVRERLLKKAPGQDVDDIMRRLEISTIHAFCRKMIGDFHHHALFLSGTFSPLDQTRRMLLLFRHGIGDLRLKEIYPAWKEREQARGSYHTDLFHFYEAVGLVYDVLSEDVLSGPEPGLRRRYVEILAGSDPQSVDERIVATYPLYWKLLQQEGYLDHSMTLAFAEALLRDPEVRSRVQGTFRHVLVDEYQDTNPIQDRIFHAVVGNSGRLFAVADDDQSIYAFRGADVNNATRFTERWPGANVEKLEENRRSTAGIVRATQELIQKNRVREPKDLWTRNPEGERPWLLSASEKDLPAALARLLSALRERGTFERWSEVGILFRGLNKRVAAYRAALEDRDVPVSLVDDRHFLMKPIVKGFLAVFEMIDGDESKITRRKRKHRPFFEALGITDRDAMLDLVRAWHRKFNDGGYDTMLDLFYRILEESGAMNVEEILPDLGHFSSFLAAAEEQLTSPDLAKRLSWFLEYAETAASSFAGPDSPPGDAIRMMTIHKAKGLEFPVVVVVDAIEGTIPAHFPEGSRDRLRRELAGLAPATVPVEEERRVLYVALTRAMNLAIITTTPDAPSPFLDELDTVPAPDPEGSLPASPARFHPIRSSAPAPLHATHTAIYGYAYCPRRYYLEERLGFAGRAIAPLRAGQSLHKTLEIYHRLVEDGEAVSTERLRRIFERAWLRPRGKRQAQKEYGQLLPVIHRYAAQFEKDRDQGMRIRETESPFYVSGQKGVLIGKIDLVREKDDRLEIVELKFHKNPLLPDYPRRQLEHYSLAFPRARPRLVVHYLQEGTENQFDTPEPEAVREGLEATFEKIERCEFPADPQKAKCGICPVRSACGERASPASTRASA